MNGPVAELSATRKPPFSPPSIPPARQGKSGASVSNASPSGQPSVSTPSSQSSQHDDDVSPQSTLDRVTSVPLTPLDSLPTIAGKGSDCFLANSDIPSFLKEDLSLKRLNDIHHLFWMVGRPLPAHALHRYRMMGYEVVCTEQLDLHLVRSSSNIMIKPLPEWILSYDFWSEYICKSRELHESACGFLVSYVWLLRTPLDLRLAHANSLMPSFVTWPWWKRFVADFCSEIDINALDQVNKRFHFGHLRLGRINTIYRTRSASSHFVRGYLYGYNRYVPFFQRKISWVLILFAFFSLVLSAMQVGAGIDRLNKYGAFLEACSGFVIFSMVTVMVILAFVGATFTFIFFFNMREAIRHAKSEKKKREKLAQQRKDA